MKLLILLVWHYERLVRCGLSFGRLHPRSPDPVGACDGLRKLILETYNFKPSKLSAAEQAEKRAWKMVESQAASQLPCLRAASERAEDGRWFLFNGSSLLLRVDPSSASKLIVGRNWSKVPEHEAAKIGQLQGAIFLFGSMDESTARSSLVKVATDSNHPGRVAAVWLLIHQITDESLNALKRVDPTGLSTEARDEIVRTLGSHAFSISTATKTQTSRTQLIRAPR